MASSFSGAHKTSQNKPVSKTSIFEILISKLYIVLNII